MIERRPTSRMVAVDYGPRRVGLAVSDGFGAHPVGTFSPEEALVRLRRLDAERGLSVIVLGWPLDGGHEGPAVERVRPFLGRLRRVFPAVAVVPIDETGTSREAAEGLYEAGQWRRVRRDKGRLDAAAACVLLTRYLEDAGNGAGSGAPEGIQA